MKLHKFMFSKIFNDTEFMLRKAGQKTIHTGHQFCKISHTHDLEKHQTRQHHITSDYLGGGGLKGHLLHVGPAHTSWKALSRGLGNTPRDGEPGGAVGTTSLELFSQYLPPSPPTPKKNDFKVDLPTGRTGKIVSDSHI